MKRIARLIGLTAAMALVGGAASAQAQNYPNKPARVIVPLPAGSPAEVVPRAMADALGRAFGQPYVVDNKPGGDAIIGAEACAKAAPDGYTLCGLSHAPIVLNPLFHDKLPYDPVNGFAPIGYLGRFAGAFAVDARLPVKNMAEFIELARSKPGSLSWATLGGTSMGPLFTAWFKQNQNVTFLQVPFKSTLEGMNAVVAGDVSSVVIAVGPTVQLARAGKLKLLAVTSPSRWGAVPEVPTMKEAGFEMPLAFNTWLGLFAPAGTPPDIVRRINAEMVKNMTDPAFKSRVLTATGLDGDDYARATPAEFEAFIRNDREVINRLAAAAGLGKR